MAKVKIPKILEEILIEIKNIGVLPILVGGCVRDSFLNVCTKDYDIELFNIACLEQVGNVLKRFGRVKEVGKSFGVLILDTDGFHFDFALARIEKKIGFGHRGFEVQTNTNLKFKETSLRRDFTINSIGYDYFKKEFLDPNNGIKDLKEKNLRHVRDESFIQDPLRVYRAIQFVARFDLKIDLKTFELCKKMVEKNQLEELPRERIFEEFKKLFLKSKKPSLGFKLLKELGVLKHFYELEILATCTQDAKKYCLEDDAWACALKGLDEMAKLKTGDEYRDLYLFYALLSFNLEKSFCTKEINKAITLYKRENLEPKCTISFLRKITDEKKFIEKIIPLVENHLFTCELFSTSFSVKTLKRLSLKCNIEDLCMVCLAYCRGRTSLNKSKYDKAIVSLLDKAKQMNILKEKLIPLVKGEDLINLGLKPSKKFKEILNFALNLQIDENLEKEEILEKFRKKYLK